MPDARITVYYVASTHWDREWYEPFQHFRYHLVETMDELLDVMAADSRFACFQTDGQSVILEDYLEIRPERESQVRRFAAEDRLRIGPWYTMPDENLVAPESLIRNLEEGIRVARDYGNVSKAGFVCDIFGHVSQLPQIFRGFGIGNAFVFRGVNEDTHRGLFRWRSPDGSELIATLFGPKDGYFDFAGHVRKGFDQETPFILEDAVQRAVDYVRMQRERMGVDMVLLFDGGDHMPIEPRTCDLLEKLGEAMPEIEIRHTGLEEYAAAVEAHRDRIERVSHGELREPGRLNNGTWLIPGVLSSRIRLTQKNRARETELCFWAEPFAHLAGRLVGAEYPHSYLRRSWRYLLENHAHDSICGCSPDQVHKDMEFRFDQARLINQKLIDRALESIAFRVNLPDLDGEDFAMVVFNPTQADIDGPVDLELWFDKKTKNIFGEFFNYESKVGFRLYDADDREIPYDYLGYDPQRLRWHRIYGKAATCQECIVVRVAAPLRIPAFGYATILCRPTTDRTRHPSGGIVAGDRALENENLRIEVNDNGSLKLHDKRTGQTYNRLLVFEDRADIGDGWFHGVAVNDAIHSSTAAPADVAVVEDGRQRATLRIRNRMEVPERFEFGAAMRRSERTATLLIDNFVTLRRGGDHVEIRTRMDNNVRDHRLRVMFESGVEADTYLADSAFDVVERNIALPADHHTYKELAVETTPHASWTAVHDGRRGLAVVAPDLPECTVRDVPERTLALTLLRGFRRTVFTDGQDGGQELGPHEFRYRLVPLNGAPPRTRLAQLAQLTAAGAHAVQVLRRDQPDAGRRTLPRTHGQLALRPGRAVVTSLRRRPETSVLEVRVFNPGDESIEETLRLGEKLTAARRVDFEGNVLEQLPPGKNGQITVKLAARQIATVAIELAD